MGGDARSTAPKSKYLLTGLAQCGWCNGGLTVQSRGHGTSRRRYFYVCTSYHLRGRTICQNRQDLPMEKVNAAVLERAGDVLLNPTVLERPDEALDTARRAVDDLHEALSSSWRSAEAGQLRPASEILDELRQRR